MIRPSINKSHIIINIYKLSVKRNISFTKLICIAHDKLKFDFCGLFFLIHRRAKNVCYKHSFWY